MNFFHYDSKPMQILMYIGDLIILNVVYILCSLPLFTIGAAQAGLYSAVKVLQDKEDDSSPTAAFFKGFANGFGTVTLAWGIMTVLLCVVVAMGLGALMYGAPLWIVAVAVCIVALFQSLVPVFHSRFSCKPLHLIRNCWFLLVGHPLRSIGVAILTWLPVIVFLWNAFTFMSIMPAWLTLYYSTAAAFGFNFMKKPFNTLIDHFNKTNAEAEQLPAAEENDLEVAEVEEAEEEEAEVPAE